MHDITSRSCEQEVACDDLRSFQLQNDIFAQLSNSERGHSLRSDSGDAFDKFLLDSWISTSCVVYIVGIKC